MPEFVKGTPIYLRNAGSRPKFKFSELPLIRVSGTGKSDALARSEAEDKLVKAARGADAIVDVMYSWPEAEADSTCEITGTPIKRLSD
ncbi:hypothetical protein KW801_04075 [Candidatus Saccharibacteria bacterium]|nr:hypothetical protein [Candidatus Saccharibacteria bacterium]